MSQTQIEKLKNYADRIFDTQDTSLYVQELGNYSKTRKIDVGSTLRSAKQVIYGEVVDGKAQSIGLKDNVVKTGDIVLKTYNLETIPYVVRFNENQMGGTEFTAQMPLRILDETEKQKDELNALLFEKRATSAGADLAFNAATFTKEVFDVIEAQKTALGITQANSELVVANDIKRALRNATVAGTTDNYLMIFQRDMANEGVIIHYSSLFTSKVYFIEGSLVDEAVGSDPYLHSTFVAPNGALSQTEWDFAFATNDLVPRKSEALFSRGWTAVVSTRQNAPRAEEKVSENEEEGRRKK